MKKVLIIIFLVTVLGNLLLAQSKTSKSYDMDKQVNVTKKNDPNVFTFSFSISEGMITTAVIVGELVILLLVLYYWKRTREDSKREVRPSYKKNIRAIRDERIRPTMDVNASLKRKDLRKYVQKRPINSSTITSAAKKMCIAKSEIFLATRIQQLQNQTR